MSGINEDIEQLLNFEKPLPAQEVSSKAPVIEDGVAFTDLIDGLMRGTDLIEEHKRGRTR